MTVEDRKVAFGYLPNFRGDRAVLFAGDQQALDRLAGFFESLAGKPTNLTTMLEAEPLFRPKRGTRLTLTIADSPAGMRRISTDSSESRFEWRISRALATHFANLTRIVASTDQPSHQYLDSDGNEVTVVVSKGEYDEAWLQQQ